MNTENENDCETDLKNLFQEFEKVAAKYQLTALVCVGQSLDPASSTPVIRLKLLGAVDERILIVGGFAAGAIENLCISSPSALDGLATLKRSQFIGFMGASELIDKGIYRP